MITDVGTVRDVLSSARDSILEILRSFETVTGCRIDRIEIIREREPDDREAIGAIILHAEL